jgi:hypothetical protein
MALAAIPGSHSTNSIINFLFMLCLGSGETRGCVVSNTKRTAGMARKCEEITITTRRYAIPTGCSRCRVSTTLFD